LNAEEDDDIVVQPDIIVVCDRNKIGDKAIIGAPDIVIEILSLSTIRHDRHTKFEIYRDAGVLEYWIVDPDAEYVERYNFADNEIFGREAYDAGEEAPSLVLEGFAINLADVFGKEDEESEASGEE